MVPRRLGCGGRRRGVELDKGMERRQGEERGPGGHCKAFVSVPGARGGH